MPPPLPRNPLGFGSRQNAQLEAFVDFTCPFSGKMFNTLMAIRASKPELYGSVDFVFHITPQPWHPQGVVIAETVLMMMDVAMQKGHDAVLESFIEVASKLFDPEIQACFTDEAVVQLRRSEIQALVLEKCDADMGLTIACVAGLAIPEGSGNSGNMCNKKLKQVIKFHRLRGVHVTPTVFVNGIEDGQIGSSWSEAQWVEKLEELVSFASPEHV
jgi:protein-disulfide isomerase